MRKPNEHKPLNDLSRSLTPFDPNQSLITVIELSKESWLVAAIIPGVERQPLKKLEPDEDELLKLLEHSLNGRGQTFGRLVPLRGSCATANAVRGCGIARS